MEVTGGSLIFWKNLTEVNSHIPTCVAVFSMSQVRSGPDYAKRRQHVMTAPGHLFPGILARCACWSSWCLRQLSELQELQVFLMNGLIITKTRMLKCGNWATKLHTRYHFVACFGQQVSYGLAIDLIMLKMVSIWVTTKGMMQTCPSWFSLLTCRLHGICCMRLLTKIYNVSF